MSSTVQQEVICSTYDPAQWFILANATYILAKSAHSEYKSLP